MSDRSTPTVLCCLALLSGCGGALTANAVVLRPAEVPVRSFPHVVIVPDEDLESGAMARRLAAHLDGAVPRVEIAASPPSLGPAAVVVRVTVTIGDRSGSEWRRRPEITCDPGGCVEMLRPRLTAVTVVEGRVRLRVSGEVDGPILQDVTADAHESGNDPLGARMRVRARLTRRVLAWTDERLERVRVPLLPLDDEAFDSAIELARRGSWAEARERAEARFDGGVPDSWSDSVRARALYDLGQLRRFAPGEPARFAEARAALERAVRLDPVRLYAEALDALEDHRRASEQLRSQRAARRHNYRLQTLHVPEGY